MTGVRVYSIVAGLALGAPGCGAFKDVPPTFAKLAAPPAEITPDPDKATVVVALPGGGYDGGAQAITVLAEDGTPIAQVVPRSYAVVHLAAGDHWFTSAIPELGAPPWCLKLMPGSFEKGKIYVMNLSGATDAAQPLTLFTGTSAYAESAARRDAGEGERTGKVLSKLSFLEIDSGLARQNRETHRDALDGCVEYVKNPADPRAAALVTPMPARHGRDRIEIPPPP